MINKIKDFLAKENLEALYDVLEKESLESSVKQELYVEMMTLATEKLHDKMAEGKCFDFEDKGEHFMLRVLYDNAIASYEAGEVYESGEAFKVLCVASNSKFFEKSLKKHLLAVMQNIDFETFFGVWVDSEIPKHFFVSKFSKVVEKRYIAESKALSIATQSYSKFFK